MKEEMQKATQRVLDDAKTAKREIVGFAIVCVYGDGSHGGAWYAPETEEPLLGALTRIQHRLNAHLDKT